MMAVSSISHTSATCAPGLQLEQVQGVLRNALLGAAAAAVVAGGVGPEGSPALPAAWAGIGGGAVTNAKASQGCERCSGIVLIRSHAGPAAGAARVAAACWVLSAQFADWP